MQEYRSFLKKQIEGLIFISNKPISSLEISKFIKIDEKEVLEILEELERDYEDRGINLYKINGKYEFGTSPEISGTIMRFLKEKREKLSKPSLETLAIIAYHQPITKGEIDALRGIKSDGIIYSLLEKGFIKIVGKKDAPGKPFLYGVSEKFYKYFLIEDERQLKEIREFED
ncbi:MAG: SMC-Scp complex subunit ScpB [Dictyoglomaceae bacterium]|nr:SMC-Scp complex subunit ScpB [Dictyoglomaceae bacterium]